MADLTTRTASLRDMKDIWSLFRQTAAEVPFDLNEDAAQEGLLSEIMCCCTYGIAPLAVRQGQVVGALLVRRDTFEWATHNGDAVHIAYAAALPELREAGVLSDLIAAVQERGVPVIASVKSGSQSGFTEALLAKGFVKQDPAPSAWGDIYTWQPAPKVTVH